MNTLNIPGSLSRRAFLGATAAMALASVQARAKGKPGETYASHAKGIRIAPGIWRPHYPWEHIAWVSPSWPSQDYIWLDFPEAIFTSQGLIYLSHVNPPIDTVYDHLPAVPWVILEDGISFERTLPSGIVFGGSVRKGSETTVDLTLYIRNGSQEPLNRITLQTCAFLRATKEFGDYSMDNKLLHLPEKGWVPMAKALALADGDQPYRVGWRSSGKRVSDVPMVVNLSSRHERLFAMTWYENTLSMVSNPSHPCAHADPWFPDLEPGESATIQGKLIFFAGKLDDFDYRDFLSR